MNIQIKKLHDDVIVPAFQTEGSAGFDLHAYIDTPVLLEPGEAFLCPTGFAMSIDDPSIAAIIIPRSGLGHKSGIVLGNGTGLIDSDYNQEIFASLTLRKLGAGKCYKIRPGDRVAQMFFIPVMRPVFNVVDEFSVTTDRGGFGSTGK